MEAIIKAGGPRIAGQCANDSGYLLFASQWAALEVKFGKEARYLASVFYKLNTS